MAKKYLTEEQVKRRLNVDSFRNLSKDNMMQFVSSLSEVDKDVALAIIDQFPSYVDFGKVAIEKLQEMYGDIFKWNNESQIVFMVQCQKIIEALSKSLEQEDLSDEVRMDTTEKMLQVADMLMEADKQNKRFLTENGRNIALVIAAIVSAIGAGIGIGTAIGKNTN